LHEQQLVERRDEVLKKIDEAMTNIAGRFDEMSGETEAAINNMIINIKYELVDWDIQRHQEESVLSVAKLCVEQATQINSSGLELDKQFDKITKAIRELTVKQNNEMFILPAPLQDMAGGLELF